MDTTPTPRWTKRLLIAAAGFFGGFFAFAVLHNLFYALASLAEGTPILASLLTGLSVATFLVAVMVCPAGVVLCLVAVPVERLTRGRGRVRAVALALIPTAAAVAGYLWFIDLSAISVRERDPAAGLNGGFEVVRAGYPVNWSFYKRPLDDGDAEIALDSTQPVGGAQSLRLRVHRAEPGDGRRDPGLFQVVDAETGRTYRVTCWLRNEGSRIRLEISSEKPESRADGRVVDVIDSGRAAEGEWTELTYRYTVPEGYANIRFEIAALAPGTFWIDDVRIEPEG
jgi:hypothetical protein